MRHTLGVTTRILFIRAVNVGGASLPMAEFRELLAGLGAREVRTYIASGNAIIDLDGEPGAFDRSVEQAVQARYGYFREVMSRTAQEVRLALEAHPFEVVEPKYSYVAFLTGEPTPQAVAAASTVATGDDVWQVVGRELHLRYANGAGRPDLNADAVLRRLGVAATARNLRTVAKLIELAS